MLKHLLNQAMPEAAAASRRQLLLHQFLSGLPIYISKQLLSAGQFSDLDKVLEWVKLLPTIEKQKKTAAAEATVPAEVVALKEQISALMEQVAAFVTHHAAT